MTNNQVQPTTHANFDPLKEMPLQAKKKRWLSQIHGPTPLVSWYLGRHICSCLFIWNWLAPLNDGVMTDTMPSPTSRPKVKKFRIRETKHLSTDAYSIPDAKKLLSIILSLPAAIATAMACHLGLWHQQKAPKSFTTIFRLHFTPLAGWTHYKALS